MSETLAILQRLAQQRKVRVSDHGNEETQEEDMDPVLLVLGIERGLLIEDYPDAFKGPTVLMLQEYLGKPVHVVWGLARGRQDTATLITAYFPDPEKWYDGFIKRKPK